METTHNEGEWRTLDSAPIGGPATGEHPPRCLVYSPEFGVRMGCAWRYADGRARAFADGYNGEWGITHWMPLPAPPPTEKGVVQSVKGTTEGEP